MTKKATTAEGLEAMGVALTEIQGEITELRRQVEEAQGRLAELEAKETVSSVAPVQTREAALARRKG